MDSARRLGIAEAFKAYGATLKNVRWALSAIATDGSLVVSLWDYAFRRAGSAMRYEDQLETWGDENPLGRELLSGHLKEALDNALPVRIVVAHRAQSGGARAEWFHVRPDWLAKVTHFDGDRFTIEVTKKD